MYHFLSGRLVEKMPLAAIIEVSGVGYYVHTPLSTHAAILTHFVVREDAQALYGFLTEEERDLFKMLLSVSGIGPKMAMTVLSGLTISELKRAIVDGALHTLSSVPGIGRKTAERMIVELREKVVLDDRRSDAPVSNALKEQDILFQDSLQALIQLGYRKQNAKEAIQKALKSRKAEDLSAETLVRESLKYV
ncbi:MAG: Holliday junction branch migration protein RuvA [Candidatus Omnitrophica bacterium]|nr:Holliday junction branch migration protein RuvA [Candidatus Omnitrophota bacterium]